MSEIFFHVEYPTPDSVIKAANGVFTIKFSVEPNSVADGIYEVRLMK